MAEAAPSLSFPTDPQEFDSDDRISFSKLDNKFIAVQDGGTEFEFDAQLKRWIPAVDEELLAQHLAEYGGEDDAAPLNKKRKKDQKDGERPQKKHKHPPKPRENTAVYVTGLPLDTTVDEVHDVFSKKCGVVAEEIDSGRPRIKLYADADGQFKGDALVVFFKPQSVEMAIMLLDDTVFRYTSSGLASEKIRVQAAESSYKKTHYEREGTENGEAAAEQKQSIILHPKDEKREQDKKKIIKKTQKLDAKLADWDDDEPYNAQQEANVKRNKVVILKHMFTLQELDEDPEAIADIKQDIREECEKIGEVTSVTLYDLEEDGVVSVKFLLPEAARACVELMDGRAFDRRVVKASIARPREKYKKANDRELKFGDDEQEED